MTRVGDRPRHNVERPSLRAILRRPSSVELNVRRLVSSTAQSVTGVVAAVDDVADEVDDSDETVAEEVEI